MNGIPLILRFALAWAALTGQFQSISVDSNRLDGTLYQFDVRGESVRRWVKRNKRRAAREAARRRATWKDEGES